MKNILTCKLSWWPIINGSMRCSIELYLRARSSVATRMYASKVIEGIRRALVRAGFSETLINN